MPRAALVVGGFCNKGHLLTEDNVTFEKTGRVRCRICDINKRLKRQGKPLIGELPEVVSKINVEVPKRKVVMAIGNTCKNGHILTEQNTYIYPKTRKVVCKICRRNSNRKTLGLTPADPNEPIENWVRDKDRKKTHCPQGHPYDEENTRYTSSGSRMCKTCVYTRSRVKNLKDSYNLTLASYNKMCEEQSNKCAICAQTLEGNLHVDHDHITGKVRGLLCNSCNNGLGRFKDNSTFLRNAADYVDKYNVI